MKKIKSAACVLFFLTAAFVQSQTEGDKIVAVIGNEIITESDFQFQIEQYARQNQLQEISPYLVQQIFQSMLTNKIILAKAEQDSILVTDDEVNKELDARIKNLLTQAGSQERLEEVYGMALPKIKSIMKEELQKNIKVERIKRKKFQNGISVTDGEIREFYNSYRDSLPEVNDEFELSHIFVERKPTESEKLEARRIAQLILDSIKQGIDFSELAKRNSGDSMSAIEGGDLGYARKGTYVKEFEEVLFNLKPGEVSEITETQFGYHIIKLNEKNNDKVKSQHILIKYPRLDTSDQETINFLTDIKSRIERGEITFEDAAKKYSQEEATKKNAGFLGKVPADQFDSTIADRLRNLLPGQISEPLKVGNAQMYGYEIYKMGKIYPSHKLDIKNDYDRIKKIAETFKENREMEKWINEIRETIYIDIRM